MNIFMSKSKTLMVKMKRIITPMVVILALLSSCREETACDTAGYALPEISLISPEGPDIEVKADSLFVFEFFFSAEAGLNTFSMNGQAIHAFTRGETESQFIFQSYFWESDRLEFLLYDLCNRSVSIVLNMTVIQSPR